MALIIRVSGIDPAVLAFYILAMQDDEIKNEELDLKKLETRIDELIATCAHLKDENESLREHQKNLTTERSQLIEKTELARTRVEAMIMRLKTMESLPNE